MKIVLDEATYEGTPSEIAENLRGLLFDAEIAPDAESYIQYIQNTYKRVFERDMTLPETDLDGRIGAMFTMLEEAGLMEAIEYA